MILILSQIPLALQIEEVSKSMTDTKGDRRLCYGIDADKAMPSPILFLHASSFHIHLTHTT